MNTENPKKAVAIAFSIIAFLGGAYTINEYFFDDEAESPVHGNYDKTMVNICEPDGDKLGSVTVAIADTTDLQHTGLSDTDYLPEDHGMLFVFDDVRERVFWMKDMDFPIDIIYADNERVIHLFIIRKHLLRMKAAKNLIISILVLDNTYSKSIMGGQRIKESTTGIYSSLT